jgi:hypothetical protein
MGKSFLFGLGGGNTNATTQQRFVVAFSLIFRALAAWMSLECRDFRYRENDPPKLTPSSKLAEDSG